LGFAQAAADAANASLRDTPRDLQKAAEIAVQTVIDGATSGVVQQQHLAGYDCAAARGVTAVLGVRNASAFDANKACEKVRIAVRSAQLRTDSAEAGGA